LGFILGGIAFRRGTDGLRINHTPDIETVLRVAQQLEERDRHPLASYVASWHSALERLSPGGNGVIFRRLMERARSILKDKLKVPDDPVRHKYLADVWKLGRPLGCAAPPTVFTLNYDLCLESALDYENKQYTTGFNDGLWTPSEFAASDRLRVYKLHGSFGWVRHPQNGFIYDRDRALQRSDIDILSADTPDELIFGTENKLKALQPFLWMVYRFYEAAIAARYIIAIGYGFNDEYINQIIGQGMASDPTKRLIVVGPGLDQSKIESAPGMSMFIYPSRTVFLSEGAKRALNELDTIVKKLTDLEAATQTTDPFGSGDP